MASFALLLLVLLGLSILVLAAPTNSPAPPLSSEVIIGLVGVIVAVIMILIIFAQSPRLRRNLRSE